MIRDYLGAVSTAATRKLPKGDRLLFVGRTRAALEAQVGPLASADDADAVAAALTALGDPDELADKERERLYSARRRGAAAEPPTLWKPPGKTSRRATPPGRPPRSGPAEPRSAGGPAESRPRRARTWPYRRTGPDDPALPGAPPAPAGSGTAEPGRPAPGNPELKKPEPGTAGPGSTVHIPQPRQLEQPPGPAIRPAPPGWDAHRDGAQPGTATGPASAGRDTGRDGAPPGRKPGTVGPGTAGSAGWLGPPGSAGLGTPTGTAGPGAANGAAGPGVSGRSVGPGAPGGTVGPGASGRSVGPGASGPSAGPGGNHGTVGPAVQNGHNGAAGPGTQNGAAPGGRNGAAAPGSQAGDTAPGPATAGPGAGPATQPGVAPADGTKPLSIVPGMGTPEADDDEPAGRRFGPPVPLAEAWLLARKNPLEAVAVLVLGIGGLLLPFPLWLVGGLIALFSRRWGKRDKWLALIGPPGFAVICMLLLGVSGGGNFFHALAQASHQFGLLLRVGSLLSAGYLVWRLRSGPRRRKTPPWLRGR
jgi:hypothetical protein